jgi:hypothetical protein
LCLLCIGHAEWLQQEPVGVKRLDHTAGIKCIVSR